MVFSERLPSRYELLGRRTADGKEDRGFAWRPCSSLGARILQVLLSYLSCVPIPPSDFMVYVVDLPPLGTPSASLANLTGSNRFNRLNLGWVILPDPGRLLERVGWPLGRARPFSQLRPEHPAAGRAVRHCAHNRPKRQLDYGSLPSYAVAYGTGKWLGSQTAR